jgi:WD40 repeat protein
MIEIRSPFKGLTPYGVDDSAFFFGRNADREIIRANFIASRLTIVYGPSGVGKSSVLNAGVIHDLREEEETRTRQGRTREVLVVPVNAWAADVSAAVWCSAATTAYGSLDSTPPALSAPGELSARLRGLADAMDVELLIVLDQFEELFAYAELGQAGTDPLLDLASAMKDRTLNARFLISIRDDALALLDRFKGLIPHLFENYLRVRHLDREAGRSAIEGPIAEYNRWHKVNGAVDIEPGLVDDVLDGIEQRTGRVVGRGLGAPVAADSQGIEAAYLQLVMTHLWDEEQEKGSLTLRRDTLAQLGGVERIIRSHLDLALASLTPDDKEIAARLFHYLVTPSGTKVAHNASDLADYVGTSPDDATRVLERLSAADARVLRQVPSAQGQDPAMRFEIYHDVLGPSILDWRLRHLEAAKDARARRLARRRKRLAVISSAAAVILLAVTIGLFVALRQTQEQLADLEPILKGHTGAVLTVKFSPDSQRVLTASGDDTARIWDVATLKTVLTLEGHTDNVRSAVFDGSGTRVLTVSLDHTARLWNAQSGEALGEPMIHPDVVTSGTFSPDGDLVATGCRDGMVRIWDAHTGAFQHELGPEDHARPVLDVAFSPDGARLVTAAGDEAVIWNVTSYVAEHHLTGHQATVHSARFDPTGTQVVTASRDYTARLWEADTGASIELEHEAQVLSAEFVPKGTPGADSPWIVTTSGDRTAKLWSASGKLLFELEGHTDSVRIAAFSPDGTQVVTGSSDLTARVWDANTGRRLAVLSGHTGRIFDVAFSSSCNVIVTASADLTARIWRPPFGQTWLQRSPGPSPSCDLDSS